MLPESDERSNCDAPQATFSPQAASAPGSGNAVASGNAGAPGPSAREPTGRDLMKRHITRLMACAALCDADFPRSWKLPQVAPVPANNLGHYVLLNYRELAALLWGA